MRELIEQFTGKSPDGDPRIVRVEWATKWQEYQCKVIDAGQRRPNADYFTKDRNDALAHARVMCGIP